MSEEGLTTISPQSSYEEDEQGDFTRWRFDIGEQLRDFEHGMTGERKTRDRDGLEKWEPIEGITPSMTAEGAREIVSPLKVLVNQVTLLSGLERNEILKTCKDINDIRQLGSVEDRQEQDGHDSEQDQEVPVPRPEAGGRCKDARLSHEGRADNKKVLG